MTSDANLINELALLRDRIFAGDNRACFVERERLLRLAHPAAAGLAPQERYAFLFCQLLDGLSCPVESADLFLGRMVEGHLTAAEATQPAATELGSQGHLTLDWETLLHRGLAGVAQEAGATAQRDGSGAAHFFAENAAQCVAAVTRFARRYAQAARGAAAAAAPDSVRQAELQRAAAALEQVPDGPARDFHSALQSMWLVHLISSCCVGSRDFALGHMDHYLYPYLARDLAEGVITRADAVRYLAHFMMKCNEITGTSTHNHQCKPIPSVASKQYLMLGGAAPDGRPQANELTTMILEAAELVRLPEPVLSLRWSAATPGPVKQRFALAAERLGGQVHYFNDDVIIPELLRRGVPRREAADYAMVGCCRLDLPGRMDSGFMHTYQYHNGVRWLLAALQNGVDPVDGRCLLADAAAQESLTTEGAVLDAFRAVATAQLGAAAQWAAGVAVAQSPHQFHFESLLLRECAARGRDCCAGGTAYQPQGHFFGGLATIANCLVAIRRLVFREQRLSLGELLRLAAADFVENRPLLQELRYTLPKFGNDEAEADELACLAAEALLAASEAARCALPPGHLYLDGFYSLDCHHRWGRELPGTPDGRVRGEPVSENQAAVYGTDRQGVTALLNSLAKLPLRRTVMGGLNVKFAMPVKGATIQALLDSYFRAGGLHVGFTFVDRATLQQAQLHPDQYRSLCVRLYGFSEYFVALSPDEQEELLARTEFVA